jgi:hypothetical protein
MSNLIGKIVEHEGKIYQILSDRPSILLGYSYGDNCGITETVLIAKESLKIIAIKSTTVRKS